MANRAWTAEVFVDHQVGTINPTVYAGTFAGAQQQIERIYGPVQQIVNLREVRQPRHSSGGAQESSGGGLGAFVLLIIGAAVVGSFGGGGDSSTPAPAPQSAPIERTYTPAPAATPSYANPPGPCVTANFEPC